MSYTCCRAVLILMFAAPVGLTADVVMTETTHAKIGGKTVDGVRTTYIKGPRMRLEVVQANDAQTTLYDVPAGVTIALDAKKKRAELRDISARNAELERRYPRSRVVVTLTPTGATKQLAGVSCDEHAFSIRVPMTKDGSLVLVMTGSAWAAKDVPGADDYSAFAAAAIEKEVVLGPASNNLILLAVTRAQTELYRALGKLRGIPYVIDMTLKVDGHGLIAGMVNKVVSGTRTSTVTKVAVAPLSDALFAIPDGWKRQKK
jgi:hypothetical protein